MRNGPILISIQVGLPRDLGFAGSLDAFEKPWTTGIFKEPVRGAVWVGKMGLAGDGQADLTVHRGIDKAVCSYCGDHYENFTIAGLAEPDVCIGDVWVGGDVVLQVSQPRQPCWKLARKWGIKEFADRVITSGRTGWYFRVLTEGSISCGIALTLRERSSPEWTISAANRVMHGRPFDREGSARLAAVPTLSASWKATLSRR
jgi:MOSC domain-containing protein YiiM